MSITQSYVQQVSDQIAQRVFGVEDVAGLLAMTRIAGGHALLQGPPGIGKTLLARSFAQALGGSFARVQGTPDLLPSDITGVTLFKPDGGVFEFRPGPLFADVVLMDEINRTGPKTQAALLEAMEERHITLDGETHQLPDNFLVIATQNPLDFEGTYPLPESQIDRFTIQVDMQYPERDAEALVLQAYAQPISAHDQPLGSLAGEIAQLAEVRQEVTNTRVDEHLVGYVLDICAASRHHDDISLGLSTRAARALTLMARVHATAAGFNFVRPDDIQAIAQAVLSHRIVLTPEANFSGLTTSQCLQQLIAGVPVPRVEAESAPQTDSEDIE